MSSISQQLFNRSSDAMNDLDPGKLRLGAWSSAAFFGAGIGVVANLGFSVLMSEVSRESWNETWGQARRSARPAIVVDPGSQLLPKGDSIDWDRLVVRSGAGVAREEAAPREKSESRVSRRRPVTVNRQNAQSRTQVLPKVGSEAVASRLVAPSDQTAIEAQKLRDAYLELRARSMMISRTESTSESGDFSKDELESAVDLGSAILEAFNRPDGLAVLAGSKRPDFVGYSGRKARPEAQMRPRELKEVTVSVPPVQVVSIKDYMPQEKTLSSQRRKIKKARVSSQVHSLQSGIDPVPKQADTAKSKLVESKFNYVEAFNQSKVINEVVATRITLEGDEGDGWILSERGGYHATVSRWSHDYSTQEVPLLSENNFSYFMNISGAQQEKGLGVIFGKIDQGWSVTVSSRAEEAVYLNDDGRHEQLGLTTQKGAFVIFNVETGLHLVTLHGPNGQAVPGTVLVMADRVTYLDGTLRGTLSFSADVLAGESASRVGLAAAGVSWVGYPELFTVTDAFGRFSLPRAEFILGLPIYIEIKTATGFKHRYRMNLMTREFYYFSEMNIQAIIERLPDGLSAESGLILATFPRFGSDSSRGPSMTVRPTQEDPPLTPEVYAWGAAAELTSGVDLDADFPRGVAVQLSEGAQLLRLKSPDQSQTLYSEFVMAQPGVVNVVVQ